MTAGDDQAVLYIDVRYSIRGTNNPRSLVFPFYVIPDHDERAGDSPNPRPATESDH